MREPMSGSSPSAVSYDPFRERPAPYEVRLVQEGEAGATGALAGATGDRPFAWSQVERAFAGEVGEPEGVRAVVIDVLVRVAADGCVAYRVSADPGPEAAEAAREVVEAVGPERCSAPLREVAKDGWTSHRFPYVELLEDDILEALCAAGRLS